MLFKNSIKILFSNFNIVWKSIVYFLFVALASIGLVYLSLSPVLTLLKETGFVDSVINVYTNFLSSLNLTGLFVSINELGGKFIEIVLSNMSWIWISILSIAIIIFFLNSFLLSLTTMASCLSLNYYMGSMNSQGFYLSFKQVFGMSLKYGLAYYITALPIKIIIALFVIMCICFFTSSWLFALLGMFLCVLGFVLLVAIKNTLFCAWAPMIIIKNYSVWKALREGCKLVGKKFGRVYGNSIGVVLTVFSINFLLGVFTFGVGLLITIPATYLWLSIFGMVASYEGQGMRYYVDIYNVVTPNKREEFDKINQMKYII